MKLAEGLEADFEAGQVVLKGEFKHEFGSVELNVKLPLIAVLKMAAAKSDNKIDDQLVELVEKALS